MAPTLRWSNMHKHISKVAQWGSELKDGDVRQFASLWGCTLCDVVSDKPFKYEEEIFIDHSDCENNPCFGCKAKTLQLATGDASGNIIASGTTQKKWDSELEFYRDARAQGVQPEGTNRKAVEKALEASAELNKPYDAGTMPKSDHITKESVAVMKEIGQI